MHFSRKRINAGRRWTWRSPNGQKHNEIDYIMTDSLANICDTTVMKRVNAGSDHRLVRSNIHIDTKIERNKRINSILKTTEEQFHLELTNKYKDLEDQRDIAKWHEQVMEITSSAGTEITGNQRKNRAHTIGNEI